VRWVQTYLHQAYAPNRYSASSASRPHFHPCRTRRKATDEQHHRPGDYTSWAEAAAGAGPAGGGAAAAVGGGYGAEEDHHWG
jgi:hypothetical protein